MLVEACHVTDGFWPGRADSEKPLCSPLQRRFLVRVVSVICASESAQSQTIQL